MGSGDAHAAGSAEHGIPIVFLRVGDTFDAAALSRIRHAVDEVLAVNPRTLLLDLTDCAHMDATGITLLLDVHRWMHRNRGRLAIHAPGPEVRRLLRLARVDHVLDVRVGTSPIDTARPASLENSGACPPGNRAPVPVQTLANQGGPLL